MGRYLSRTFAFTFICLISACAGEPTAEKPALEPVILETVEQPTKVEDQVTDNSGVETTRATTTKDEITKPPTPAIESKPKPKPKPPIKKVSFAKIDFEDKTYDFGELTSGDKTDHKFTFVNAGKAPLEIKNVHVSCGCTIPSYPFIPIDPGEEGYIGVAYNSVGKEGFQRATVRVITNDPNQKEVVLNIEGTVNKKDKPAKKDTSESN